MPEWILQLLPYIFSAGFITAIGAWIRDAKKAPIEAQTAQIADAIAISNAASGLVKIQNDRTAEQDAKIDKLVNDMHELRSEVFIWQVWYSGDLVVNWATHRKKEVAPPAPKKIS